MLLRNLYDSHVHFMATGQKAQILDLSSLSSWRELARIPTSEKNFRGEWLVGFGWNENQWSDSEIPTAAELSRIFPDFPVYLSRCDGHAGLTNLRGLQALDVPGSGLFKEQAHLDCLRKLPPYSDKDRRGFLLAACRAFNEAGFTHIRDLGGNEAQFLLALELEREGLFSLQVDWNFPCRNLVELEEVLAQAERCRAVGSPLNQVRGIKFFFDGSLGSDTALLSQPYAHRCDGGQGSQLWTQEDAEKLIRRTWESGFEVAVHTLGDEAADRVIDLARKVSAQGLAGRLNLEHVEVLRPETITKMKPLHVVCHLQPCHWLSDREWLGEKLGDLKKFAFPWEALRKAKIPFFFGSDSPVENASPFRNIKALQESARHGIPELKADPWIFHRLENPRVAGETRFEGATVAELKLGDRVILSPAGVG